jgi:hypothetical protein
VVRYNHVAIVLLLVAGLGHAQDSSPADQATIRQLVQQVRELQERVKALEAQRPSGSSAPDSVATPAAPPAAPETADDQAAAARFPQELHELRGIQWQGFGEADYQVLDQRKPELATYGSNPGSAGNFYTGAFALVLTSRINDKASVLSEITFTEGDAQSFDVDLERILLKYEYNDHLRMSFGRFQTAIGYYNTAYHSGSWLQTTADRPLIMEYADNGGPLPLQAVGMSITGLIPSGAVGLNYIAEYGSSDTIRPLINSDTGITEDENNGNYVAAGFFARPASLPGLQVGGTVYHDQISDFARGPSVRLGQTIANLHVVYEGKGFEFLNEGFLIRHAYEQSSTVYDMPAFYSQVARRFGRTQPFFRFQYIHANQDSLFQDIALRYGPSFGARYDINDNIAFKVQLDHTIRQGQPDLNGFHVQLAFKF